MSDKESVSLYKNGDSHTFEGNAIVAAKENGWKDKPQEAKKKTRKTKDEASE